MVTAETMAATLNEALRVDPACISDLNAIKRTCGKALADHPTIQVEMVPGRDDMAWIRFIDLLNGMLLDAGSKDVLVAVQDDASNQNLMRYDVKPYVEQLAESK